jgi:hypothetical protein
MLRKLPFSGMMRKRSHEDPATPQGHDHHLEPAQSQPAGGGGGAIGGVPVPFGWEVAVSRSTGEQYFVNTETGQSTFELPDFTVSEKLEQYARPRPRARSNR